MTGKHKIFIVCLIGFLSITLFPQYPHAERDWSMSMKANLCGPDIDDFTWATNFIWLLSEKSGSNSTLNQDIEYLISKECLNGEAALLSRVTYLANIQNRAIASIVSNFIPLTITSNKIVEYTFKAFSYKPKLFVEFAKILLNAGDDLCPFIKILNYESDLIDEISKNKQLKEDTILILQAVQNPNCEEARNNLLQIFKP